MFENPGGRGHGPPAPRCRRPCVRSLIFPLILRSCVSKFDSCSWYDSWLQKNYRLLLLFNSCHKLRRMQRVNANLKNTMIKNHSCSCSNRKNPLLVLLRILSKNAKSIPVLWLLHTFGVQQRCAGVDYGRSWRFSIGPGAEPGVNIFD